MPQTRRWLKATITAAAEPQIALPWQRGSRRRPVAMKPQAVQACGPSPILAAKSSAIAAH